MKPEVDPNEWVNRPRRDGGVKSCNEASGPVPRSAALQDLNTSIPSLTPIPSSTAFASGAVYAEP